MDRSDVIELISTTYTKDRNGILHDAETSRSVFCQVDSVTRSEFYEAGRSGLNPEYRVTMFGPDYGGEKVVEYNGKRYAVYRVYQARTDVLELYIQREGGTNG